MRGSVTEVENNIMRETRYYEKKQEGKFFARCPRDSDPDIQDGRFWREWVFGEGTAGEKRGKTLGWESERLKGFIESAYIKEFDDRFTFNIGLQNDEGVDVLTVELDTPDSVSVANILRGIDLEFPIEVFCKAGAPYKNKYGKTVTPQYLAFKQPSGTPDWTYAWDSSTKSLEGLAPGVTKRHGKKIYDFTKRNEAMDKEIREFCEKVTELNRKDSREQTPAEINADQSGSNVSEAVEEDVPF